MGKSKIIAYDLRTPGRNYNNLYELIKSYMVYARISESVWFISSDATCVSIRDNLSKSIDANDSLFVAELGGAAAWQGISNEVADYLRLHL